MATMLGSLLVSLGLESGQFKSGLSSAEKELRAAQKRIEKVGAGMVDFGTKMSMAVTVPMIGLIQQSIKGFQDQEQAMAQVNAALASMGDVSGKTSAELAKTADALEMRSLFDADIILKQVTANLLTFGNVAGAQFDRAQQAALDMATRMGGEPQAAAIMLGKALNDPVKGISALTRVGVQFTEQQKAQIAAMQAAGNTAGAQGVILAEVERQFRGAAAAAADASPWRTAQVAIGQAMDAIGKAALPAIKPVADAIANFARWFASLPEPLQQAAVYVGLFAATLGPVAMGLGAITSFAAPMIAFISGFAKLGAIVGILQSLIPLVISFGRALMLLAANPVGLTIMGIAAAVGAVYLAWKNWDKITAIMANLYNGVKGWLVDKLGKVWDWVVGKIKWVSDAFFKLYDAVVGHSYIPDMVDGIADEMARLDTVMVKQADSATSKTAQAFKDLAAEVQPLMDQLFPDEARLNEYRRNMDKIARAASAGVISSTAADEAVRRLRSGGAAPATQVANTDGELSLAGDPFVLQDALQKLSPVLDTVKEKWGAWGRIASDTYVTIADQLKGVLLGAQSLGDALTNIAKQLASRALDGIFDIVGKAIGIPGFANGTRFAPGGMAVVGERGPELVNLPRGSQVIPNKDIRGGGGFNITVDARGSADPAAVRAQVQQGILEAAPAIIAAAEARTVQGMRRPRLGGAMQ